MAIDDSGSGERITNFGGNVSFVPRHRYAPRSEAELCEVLDRHAGGAIRVIASLHSWSEDAVSPDVVVDMRHFDAVTVEARDGTTWATVGAGAVLRDVIAKVRAASGSTVPTIGAVKVQTIAGAVSTATHGSGRSSLSHYVAALRVAAFDPASGRARIVDIAAGDELRAARAAIGAMGILVSVRLGLVDKYLVAETLARRESLDEVLADVGAYPLTQFVLVPHLWSYVVFQRREAGSEREGAPSWWWFVWRAYMLIGIDVAMNGVAQLLAYFAPAAVIRAFYRHVFMLFAWRGVTVVDRSERALTMRHELFKHLEMEVFTPSSRLHEAVSLARAVTAVFAGDPAERYPDATTALDGIGMLGELRAHAGSYTHHYPIFCRRIMPDDTLISMTAGATEPWFTMSFFSYREPRDDFYVYARFLARALSRLYGSRLHWGKYFPLDAPDIDPLYPHLPTFRDICRQMDPNGIFINPYLHTKLGFNNPSSK
jgi:FAD/FMN-containing dehydrogenase